MNTHTLMAMLLGLCFAANGFAADAPSTKTPSKDEIELLRRVLQEQRANPDKIIRTPSATSAPPTTATTPKTQAAPPPTSPTLAPAPAVKTEVASPSPTLAPKVEATKPAPVATPVKKQTPSTAIPTNFPTWTELEDAYLNRKISSKRFEEALKLLERHKQITNERQDAVTKMLLEKGIEPPAPPASPAEQKKISDVEGKVDELMRLKAQREQAPAGTAASTAPLSKRERLNELLRQMVDGKITDAEYKEKRDKIIAEPD